MKLAIVLAAGLGSRLKERTKVKPKGFLEVGGISLIERSIHVLLSYGIEKIYIGTGYCSEIYDAFAKQFNCVETIKSEYFATTSSMETLFIMKNLIRDDFLLLESDILYEKNAVRYLIEDERKDSILAGEITNSKDEVYIEVDNSYTLMYMSKDKNKLHSVYGEFVGISRISLSRYALMCNLYEESHDRTIDYEYIMVRSSKIKPFFVKKVKDLAWCEIDNEYHLQRAVKEIMPHIRRKDGRN